MSEKLISADDVLKYTVLAGEIKNPYMEVVPAYFLREAVAVVRCGDCRHIVRIGNAYYCKVWSGHNGYGIDGFCSYGERREKNEVD